MNKKLLFSATLREIRFLLEKDYLNEKGKEWANSFKCDEKKEKNGLIVLNVMK